MLQKTIWSFFLAISRKKGEKERKKGEYSVQN